MLKDTIEIETVAPIELVRYCSRMTCAAKLVESGDEYWLELCRQVNELAAKNLAPERCWLEFKLLFFGQWRFAVETDDYFSVQGNNFYSLMTERTSNNALVTIVIVELLQMLGLDVEIVDFPGPLVIKMSALGGIYIDPLTGDELAIARLDALVRGHLGDYVRLQDEHLKIADPEQIKKRYLISLKQACLLEQKFENALILNQLLLDILPNDPQQRMERGFVLQQLECFKGASDDFSFFIDNCPDDPNSDVLKIHVKALEQQTNIYH